MITAFFDGLVEPRNPGGHACLGYSIEDWPIPGEVTDGNRYLGHGPEMTNNRAEYEAALEVLKVLWRAGYRGPVTLKGDSQLVVRQFSGQYACNVPALRALLARLRKAAEAFESLTLEWIPRTENEPADAQSQRAYTEATGRVPLERHKKGAKR